MSIIIKRKNNITHGRNKKQRDEHGECMKIKQCKPCEGGTRMGRCGRARSVEIHQVDEMHDWQKELVSETK